MAKNDTTQKSVEGQSALDGIKKNLGKATDLAGLKMKLRKAINRRKECYTRLGELAYAKYRPREDAVTEDIENAITATIKEITTLSQSITDLELRVSLLKADMRS